MSSAVLKICSASLWEQLSREDPTCTFFQTPAWHGIATRHFHAESAPLLFEFETASGKSSEKTSACLPLLKKRSRGRDFYFSPFGTYTALICPRKLEAEELAAIVKTLGRLALHLISSPFTPNAFTVGKILPAKAQVIDLKTVDAADPMRDWGGDHRRRARNAQRDGVRVRPAESESDWNRYYELYELSLQRWGDKTTMRHPKPLFDDIRERLGGGDSMRLWLAEYDGEIGAGYLAFYHNRHAVNWHGAADERFFKLGATQILTLAMIEDALRRGFEIFDLAGSSGLSKLEFFKSQFGSHTVEFQSSLNRPGLLGLAAKLRDALSIRAKD